MSEFKDELKRLDLAINLPSKTYFEIEEKFNDWQPPKQLVEVPQFVADWFEDSMEGTFAGVISSYAFNDIEAVKWVQGNGGIDLLCRMKLDGYTVKKEKKYILKHIDLSKLSSDDSLYLAHGLYKELEHIFYKDVNVHNVEQCHFTQKEIDKLNIGSYEQIEVEP